MAVRHTKRLFGKRCYATCVAFVCVLAVLLLEALNRVRDKPARLECELQEAHEVISRATAARAVADEAVRHLQRMEIVGQLGSSVAHDFNNVLAAIMGDLNLLEKRISGEHNLRLLRGSYRAAQRGAAHSQRLLRFVGKRPRELSVNSVVALVEGIEELLPVVGSAVHVELQLDPGTWLALGDSDQIETAILNLAINARDAMANDGTLRIKTTNVRFVAEDCRPDGLACGEYVVLSVTDTGTGMNEEITRCAFTPFFTTKEAGKGDWSRFESGL